MLEKRPRFAGVALTIVSLSLVATAAKADIVNVTPGDMGSWSFAFNAGGPDYLPCVSCQNGSMVTGPATPPLGTGSANLQTTPGNGDGASSIATSSLNGIALADLTALSYSTYDTQNNGQQFPYIQLNISYTNDANNDGPGTDTLFFEPPYQTTATGDPSLPDQGATVMDEWQTWNALEGGWWDNNGVANPGSGVAPLSTFLSFYDNPTIIANVPYFPNDGLAVTVGFGSPGDNYDGYVDNVTIGINGADSTYNFDPVPEPSALMLLGTICGGLSLMMRRKLKKSA
jgi:hypothetical protein